MGRRSNADTQSGNLLRDPLSLMVNPKTLRNYCWELESEKFPEFPQDWETFKFHSDTVELCQLPLRAMNMLCNTDTLALSRLP
jgi:hypothetical protein